jgi:hypothetical protein
MIKVQYVPYAKVTTKPLYAVNLCQQNKELQVPKPGMVLHTCNSSTWETETNLGYL